MDRFATMNASVGREWNLSTGVLSHRSGTPTLDCYTVLWNSRTMLYCGPRGGRDDGG